MSWTGLVSLASPGTLEGRSPIHTHTHSEQPWEGPLGRKGVPPGLPSLEECPDFTMVAGRLPQGYTVFVQIAGNFPRGRVSLKEMSSLLLTVEIKGKRPNRSK